MEFVVNREGAIAVITPTPSQQELEDLRTDITAVRKTVNALIQEECGRILLDLSRIEFLSSTEIGALVGCTRQIHARSGLFMLCGIGPRLAETLTVVQLHRVLAFRVTRNEAIAALKKGTADKSAYSQLVSGNPKISEVRKAWGESGGQSSSGVHKVKDESLKVDKEESSGQANDKQESAEKPAEMISQDMRDWLDALKVMRTSRELFARHGLKFDASMSFRDFIARLAEHIVEK